MQWLEYNYIFQQIDTINFKYFNLNNPLKINRNGHWFVEACSPAILKTVGKMDIAQSHFCM